jgi:DNA modification methylase
MSQILNWFTKPGDMILDPYAGSGSTLVACLKTGRNGIGIEIDEGHVATANRRIERAMTPLFA